MAIFERKGENQVALIGKGKKKKGHLAMERKVVFAPPDIPTSSGPKGTTRDTSLLLIPCSGRCGSCHCGELKLRTASFCYSLSFFFLYFLILNMFLIFPKHFFEFVSRYGRHGLQPSDTIVQSLSVAMHRTVHP